MPRPHESGGKYGKGIIGKRYVMGQTIDIEVDIRYIDILIDPLINQLLDYLLDESMMIDCLIENHIDGAVNL